MLSDSGRKIWYSMLMVLRIQCFILLLSLNNISKAQTPVSLQLCDPPIKGSPCQMSCITEDQTETITFYSNENYRGNCSVFESNSYCDEDMNQHSGNVTTYDIAALNRASDEGDWKCEYGTDTDTKKLTVLTIPPKPPATALTDSSGMTANILVGFSDTLSLRMSYGCTYPAPTTDFSFIDCGYNDPDPARDPVDSTPCESHETTYLGGVSTPYIESLAGRCFKVNVVVKVNGYTAWNVISAFNITFAETPCLSNPCQNNGTCTNYLPYDNYTCSCPTGFYGTNCETATTVSWCHPDTGSIGSKTRCSQIPGFSDYQTSTCMSVSEMQSTAPHVQCTDSCRSYCILSCMAEKYGNHSGEISTDCICDPGERTDAATGIPSWCFRTQGRCDFFSTCLQSRFTDCALNTTGLSAQCEWISDALNDTSNCSTKDWMREVRICFQGYFISSLDSEANTNCSDLTSMMTLESYDQCLRVTTADNLDFCDLLEDDKARIRSSFIVTFSSDVLSSIVDTIRWMESC